jgi:hypothetical protein
MTSQVGAAVGGGLNVLAGILGELAASGDEAAYQKFLEQAAQQYGNISAPALERLIAQEAGQSAMAGAPSDFGNQGARNAAIKALMDEGLAGGNSLDAKMTQAQAQRAAGQATRQATASALSSAASRGVGGAASVLQAQLMGASQGADRAAQVGLEGAYTARQQALQALQQGGAMAGQAESQDSARDIARRQALDAMAQFNANQRSRTNEYNSQMANQAFQNQMQVADRKSEAAGMRAGAARGRADAWRKKIGGVGQGIASVVGAF